MNKRFAVLNKDNVVDNVTMAKSSPNPSWVECGNDVSKGFVYDGDSFTKQSEDAPIFVDVSLSEKSVKLESESVSVNYTVNFSEDIESPTDVYVPISITDRNGQHVDNVGLHIPANTPTSEFTGTFTIDKRGDFTVTNEAINFHESTGMNIINRKLVLSKQPWLRVYQ